MVGFSVVVMVMEDEVVEEERLNGKCLADLYVNV